MFQKKQKFYVHKKNHDITIPTVTGGLELAASDQTKINKRCFLGHRHLITLIGFLSCFLMSTNRLVLSVGIVAMVKHRQPTGTSKWNESDISCPLPSTTTDPVAVSNLQGEFDWSTELQGYLLGVSFLGYVITQIPAGRLADVIGAKVLMISSNIMAGLFVLISPLAARWNVYALIAVQFLRGGAQGFTTPAMYKMMSNWIPRDERGLLNSLPICGYTVGVAVGGIITGWICDTLGWPSAFYIWGAICLVISIISHFIYYEYPANNPWITDEELKYITDGLEAKVSGKPPPTPWKKIFTSIPCYAYFYGLLGHYWGIAYFFTVHPTFIGAVLHYSTAENGLFSCLPVSMTTVAGVLAGMMSHWVSNKNWISLNNVRKIATVVSAFAYSLCMVGILLAGCDATINILYFALSLFSLGIAIAGVMISGVDMAPTFAGSLSGLGMSIAGAGSFFVPVITGLLTGHETLSEWQKVFWINLAVVGSSGLVYLLFGSAEVQPWNYPDGEHPNESTNKGQKLDDNADKNLRQTIEIKENIEMHKA